MKKLINIPIRGAAAALLLAVALLCSCTREPLLQRGGTGGETVVILSLKIPAGEAPLSRALDELTDEIGVKSIEVLVFDKDGKYRYTSYGKVSGTTATVNLVKSVDTNDKYDLVVFANSREVVMGQNLTVGDSKGAVLNALEMSLTGKWPSTPATHPGFPMCSDPEALKDQVITGANITGIALYRMVARVNVTVFSGARANFDLKSVRIYNRNTTGKLKPIVNVVSSSATTYTLNAKPSPAATPLLYDSNEEILQEVPPGRGVSCTNEIYLFEVDNNASGLTLQTRPCLVIGGYFTNDSGTRDAAPTYYRVDFRNSDGNWLDIKRNHKYEFNIISVGGRGYASEDEAFGHSTVNMVTNVTTWDDSILKVVTDGQYDLGVNRKQFTFPVAGASGENNDNRLVVSTTYTGTWTVGVMNASTTGSWLTVQTAGGSAGYSVTMPESPTGAQQNFYLQTGSNGTGASRTATIRITSGRLTMDITVTQTPD